MLAFFGVATGLIGKLLGREREMTQLAEYDLLTGLANRYATLRGLRNNDVDAGEPVAARAAVHRSRQLQDRQRHARPQRRRHRAADDRVAPVRCGRRRRLARAHRRRRVRRGDEGRRRRAARGTARGSDHPDVRRTVRRARQLVRAACEHRHRAAHGGERERDRPAEEGRPRDVQREGRRQELLPVLCAAPVAPRRPPDALGAATRVALAEGSCSRTSRRSTSRTATSPVSRRSRAGIIRSTASSPRTNSFRLPNRPA